MTNPFATELPVLLAPMAGYTDAVFRALCASFGCDLAYTEMVSAKGLSFGNERTGTYLALGEDEQRIGVQIFGHEPALMAEVAARICDLLGERLFCIDINMGCPVPKVVNGGDGSALMKTPALAGEVVEAVKRASRVPVTVKFRKGWDGDTCVPFAKVLEEHGADALCLHPRTRAQMYEGKADRTAIAAVKAAVRIPVIGNGDVTGGEDARSLVEETHCDGVMIGRGALGRPWIFAEVKAALQNEAYQPPSRLERMQIACLHAERIEAEKGAHGLIELRKHLPQYLKGMRGAATLRQRLNEAKTVAEIRHILLDSAKDATI